MNPYTLLGAGELALGLVLLFRCRWITERLPRWLGNPLLIRVLACGCGLAVAALNLYFLLTVSEPVYSRRRAVMLTLLGIATLFLPAPMIAAQSRRFTELARRGGERGALVVGMGLLGSFLLLIGWITFQNGRSGLE
jgi:hypothetical protein